MIAVVLIIDGRISSQNAGWTGECGGSTYDVMSVAVELGLEPGHGEGDGEEVEGVARPC